MLQSITTQESSRASPAEAASPPSPQPYGLDDLMGISATTGAISPTMARTMRETMHFERQRAINARNVTRLAEEMKRGWFLAGTPVFICVLPNKQQVIVNGNHTLEAVAESGVTIPLTMIRKQVRDMEDAARVYATFDLQKMRTWQDSLQAKGFRDDLPMPNSVLPALGVIMQKFAPNGQDAFANNSREARFAMIPDYRTAVSVIASALSGAPAKGQRIVKRAAFLAVALYTAKYQPSVAIEFWGGLAKDDGLRKGDPRKALANFATDNPSSGAGNRPRDAKAAMLAWNANFTGRQLDFCRPSSYANPAILGTPCHKGLV